VSTAPDAATTSPVLVYDGACPVCSQYVRYVRIRDSAGALLLVNARDGGPWVDQVVRAGLDLDEGMVLFYGGRLYHGVDCVHMLALLSTRSGAFNRLTALAFSRPAVARVTYPIMRSGRNVLLRLLNRPKLSLG
jgi:predicted DCC family thiol-disulfide oxidoreductase YuxK